MSRVPSAFYPEYFKLDLGIGLPGQHPMATALDDLGMAISECTFKRTWQMRPIHLSAERADAFLVGVGFAIGSLLLAERRCLFERTGEILRLRGSLKGIVELAEIFLGPCEVTRGKPQTAAPLSQLGDTQVWLTDLSSKTSTIFIRCEQEIDSDREKDFIASAALLLPHGMGVQVAAKMASVAPYERGMRLTPAIKLNERRL